MSAKKIIALTLVFTGIAILIGYLVLTFIRNKQPTAGLKVDSSPQSLVFLNGNQIGATPLEQYFPPGEITLKLVPNASASSLISYETKLRLTDKVFTVVRRDFGSTDQTSSGEIITLQPQSETGAGLSVVSSGPQSASVLLDNQPQGFTPLTITSLSPGTHQITISSSGYKTRNIQAQAISGYKLVINSKLAIQNTVSPTPTSPPTATASATPATLPKPYVSIKNTPTGFLRVRASPSVGAEEIGQVKPGQQFPLLNTQSGWLKIKVDLPSTTSGWISSQYAQQY